MSGRILEELLWHMKTIARVAENEWASNFARSILRQSRCPDWRPSAKQEALMQMLVVELFLFQDGDDFDVFEDE